MRGGMFIVVRVSFVGSAGVTLRSKIYIKNIVLVVGGTFWRKAMVRYGGISFLISQD